MLSPHDRVRVAAVELLAAQGAGAVTALIDQLGDPSWVVRRKLIAALAQLGDAAVAPLCDFLATHRTSEAAIAAAVDALSASAGSVLGPVTALTTSAKPAVVCDAAQILGRRRRADALPVLANLLRHADDNVAVAAVEALGRIGGAGAVDALLEAANTDSFFRTFPIIDVLAQAADFRAVGPLVRWLADPLYEAAATRALGALGGDKALTALVHKLIDANVELLPELASALRQLDQGGNAQQKIGALLNDAQREQVSQRLASALVSADEPGRGAIAWLMGELGGPRAVTGLGTLLAAGTEVKDVAARALIRIGPPAQEMISSALRAGPTDRRLLLLPLVGSRVFGEAVAECLADPEPLVRARACEALARIGDPRWVKLLFSHLAEPDLRVAQAALAAVQSLGSDDTKQLALAAARSADVKLQRAALRIIGYFGYAEGLDAVVDATSSSDERARDAAIQALPFISVPAASERLFQLAKDPSPKTRASAMRALARQEPSPKVTESLRLGVSDPDPWVRYYACQAAGKLADASLEETILKLVNDGAGQVRVAAVDALSRLKSTRALQALVDAAGSSDADVRRAALLGLGAAKAEQSIRPIQKALESDDAATRLVALSAAAELDGPQALPTLVRAAGDSDEGVRTAAIGFLARSPSEDATAALVALLVDEQFRKQVAAALAVANEARLRHLLKTLQSADEALAPVLVQTLAQLPEHRGYPTVLEAARSGSVSARRAAIKLLALSSRPDARAALHRSASSDPDRSVRELAALALGGEG